MGAPCFIHAHQTVGLIDRPAHLSPTLSRRRSSPEDSSTSRSKTRPGLIPARTPPPPSRAPPPLPRAGEGPKGSERGKMPKKSKNTGFFQKNPCFRPKQALPPHTLKKPYFLTLEGRKRPFRGSKTALFWGPDPKIWHFLGSRPYFWGPNPYFWPKQALEGPPGPLGGQFRPSRRVGKALFYPSGGSENAKTQLPFEGPDPPFPGVLLDPFQGYPPYPGEGGGGSWRVENDPPGVGRDI